eukprot:1074093-Pleurochrysis_carterae.AAC.1
MQPPMSSSASAYGKKLMCSATRFINLEAEMVYLDKKTVRSLRERDYVLQVEAAAQKEGAAVAAEEARTAYETNLKQQQAAANVKYKSLLKQIQEERNASSEKVTGLEATSPSCSA